MGVILLLYEKDIVILKIDEIPVGFISNVGSEGTSTHISKLIQTQLLYTPRDHTR